MALRWCQSESPDRSSACLPRVVTHRWSALCRTSTCLLRGGLLGIVASPGFDEDRTIYASVSGIRENRIVALTIADDYRSLAIDRVLLDGIQTADRHHGGRLAIGPDGQLWIGTGDAFEPSNAATAASLNGKILRIGLDGSVPEDNP